MALIRGAKRTLNTSMTQEKEVLIEQSRLSLYTMSDFHKAGPRREQATPYGVN